MTTTIIGLDPGASTGIAVFQNGSLWKLETIAPYQIAAYLQAAQPSRVVFEDSRLTSFMFTTVKSRPAALKMARNVGEVDAWCRLITSVCEDLRIPVVLRHSSHMVLQRIQTCRRENAGLPHPAAQHFADADRSPDQFP